MLRLAFSTAEPSAPGRRAATLGYRVHIHKERAMSRGTRSSLTQMNTPSLKWAKDLKQPSWQKQKGLLSAHAVPASNFAIPEKAPKKIVMRVLG